MSDSKDTIIKLIASQHNLSLRGVQGVVDLLDDGATIPFISRYRKEATGGADEQQVADIKTSYEKLSELVKRKLTIISSIEEQGKLTELLRTRIEECFDPIIIEDIYMPFKPKRRTKAMVARERGLEPLAGILMRQDGSDPQRIAARFVKDDVEETQMALDGACDIMAEWISESEKSRSVTRRLFTQEAKIVSKVTKDKQTEGAKYSDYFACEELLRRTPSHRLLAMVRGEREGILKLSVSPDEDRAIEQLERIFVKGNSPAREYVEKSVKDGYKRLLKPSIESESLSAAKQLADIEAIKVFAENLRQLLLSAPLGQRRVLAIDPGFRSGCKVVCLDAQGNLVHNENIYPHQPQTQTAQAAAKLTAMIDSYKIEAIAIGDGTAGRETEQLIKSLHLPQEIEVFMVSEDGASVYSASPIAREEFPEYDLTVRGSVSIGRRLIDPLAELVKIDPKAIGVGQYQHDVDQNKLKQSLDTVVESCVNRVGVGLNTASKHLLAYVSGLGVSLAKSIVDFRSANGAFTSRQQLLKVPRLGAKAYEQCAGFLRIDNAANPLDNSAIHPESYGVVEHIAADLGVDVAQLLKDKELQKKIDIKKYVTDKVGLPTLTDIVAELAKPSRDPRTKIKQFEFAEGVHSINDLIVGMELPGIVTNITNFGAFVDVGAKQDGLVHISQLANKYVSNPNDVVKLHEHVTVRVTDVDMTRGRIALSMRL